MWAGTLFSLGAPLLVAIAMVALGACEEQPRDTVRDDPARAAHSTDRDRAHPPVIRRPDGPPTVETDLVDFQGNPVGISCSTCHSMMEPNRQIESAEELEAFHQGLTFDHGGLSCLSCHDERNYDQLRRADGREIDFANVMQSCAQCHGRQHREFERGVHGGMTGYWDESRGAQHRNNCIDCHDPHAPAYPQVTPVLPPDGTDWARQLEQALESELNQ